MQKKQGNRGKKKTTRRCRFNYWAFLVDRRRNKPRETIFRLRDQPEAAVGEN